MVLQDSVKQLYLMLLHGMLDTMSLRWMQGENFYSYKDLSDNSRAKQNCDFPSPFIEMSLVGNRSFPFELKIVRQQHFFLKQVYIYNLWLSWSTKLFCYAPTRAWNSKKIPSHLLATIEGKWLHCKCKNAVAR